MTNEQEVIEMAGSLSDSSDSIRDLKRIAVDALTEADPDTRVITMPNFNHSYLPDFVLEWPKRSSRDHRFVYLRSSSYLDELQEDVTSLRDKEPVFLYLSDLESASHADGVEAPEAQALDEAATRSHSLVSSIPAIRKFRGIASTRQTGQLISSYVVRGGQGLIEDDTATRSAEVIESGFQGALLADRELTLQALATVEQLLNPASATQFSHLLEAAWVSSGASVMEFPGGVTSLGDKLPAPLLYELIRMVSAESEEFWTRVGGSVDVDSFTGLHLVGQQPALQLLVPYALKNLRSRQCTVRRTVRSDQASDPYMWQVDNGILSLRGGGFQSWLASAPGTGDDIYDEPEVMPTINKVVERCKAAQLPLVQVESDNRQGTLSYSSREDADLTSDTALSEIGRMLGLTAAVSSAIVNLRGGKRLHLDFVDNVAFGKTKAMFPVRDLLIAAWFTLLDMSSEQQYELLSELPAATEGWSDD
ncbi:hypothetical protein [Nocardia brasiliensis]|uniref:hypothetical protein n=1 Tax=Nocardia brasiliensis TaxID=37326 RepID=UPI0004A6CEE3|nr:hypothetical protein [Nocardia brasiliensis]